MSNSLLKEVQSSVEAFYSDLEKERKGWVPICRYVNIAGYEFRFVDFGGVLDVYYVPANKDEVALVNGPFLAKRADNGLKPENCKKIVTEAIYARLKGYYYCSVCGKSTLWDSPISKHRPLCKACYFKNKNN